MLQNLHPIQELRSLARARAKPNETKSVAPQLADEWRAQGWETDRVLKRSVRLKKPKSHGQLFEDRVWYLFYRLRFTHLSGRGGASLLLNAKAPTGPKSQIDVLAADTEVIVAIEAKSSEKPSKRPKFQEELAKHAATRERIANAVQSAIPAHAKRKTVLAMFLANVMLSDNDKERARQAKVVLFDQDDLEYYESLAAHIGPAARYQLLADLLPAEPIPGLSIRVPAVKAKIGGFNCYTFSMTPEYLLKIAYVSHRSRGRSSDVPTYQRMLRRSRLARIREYISEDGIFPTNIVVNLDPKRLLFEKIHQKKVGSSEAGSSLLGWLEIRPAYKSAWIIDGQHRLYAYSGHPKAPRSRLAVLAFEGLPPETQASLFVDINAKQKAVKQSLLQELYAELHWEAEDPRLRLRAIISRAVQRLDVERTSPFHQRIQTADAPRTATRCITLPSLFGAIEKTGFHIIKEKSGQAIQYGPLWAGSNEATLERTVKVLAFWFSGIRDAAPDWWAKGAGPGGGLAMSDSVASCVNVLRSAFAHLDSKGVRLLELDDQDLCEAVGQFLSATGQYLATLDEEGRKRFRELRGIQGQTTRTRRIQQVIRGSTSDFAPPGLDEFISQERAQTNARARDIIDRIETNLQQVVREELRREFGEDESQWWLMGVPKAVRVDVAKRYEEDGGRRGAKERYFNLIDYREIAVQNWALFEPLLAFETTGNKDKKTQWIVYVNDKRNAISHPSSGVTLTFEELNQLQSYDEQLTRKLLGEDPPP